MNDDACLRLARILASSSRFYPEGLKQGNVLPGFLAHLEHGMT